MACANVYLTAGLSQSEPGYRAAVPGVRVERRALSVALGCVEKPMLWQVLAQQRRGPACVADEPDEDWEGRLLGRVMQRGDLRTEQQEAQHQEDTQGQ